MRPLGVLYSKIIKLLKISFTSLTNEYGGTAQNTRFDLDFNGSIAGGKLNLNNSSTCSLRVSQLNGGTDWFNLQRDFDMSFDFILGTGGRTSGEIITIEDNSESSTFRLDLHDGNTFRILHGGGPSFNSAISTGYIIPVNTPIAVKIEYRRTAVKVKVNGTTIIDATGWQQRISSVKELWLGGSGASDTIVGSIDNFDMILYK